jgi:hypothetical protein
MVRALPKKSGGGRSMASNNHEHSRLRYVSPNHLEVPLPKGPLDVRDRQNRTIGHFDGVVFDPIERRVRYLVVDRRGLLSHQRYLVPIDPTQIDVEHRAFRVGLDREELSSFRDFDPRAFPDFSDEDLIDALFASPATGSEHTVM